MEVKYLIIHHQLDIDECDIDTDECEQQCKNTDGSYVCGCWSGFTLHQDRKRCKGM